MVNVIHWNPKKKVFKTKPLSWIPIKKSVNNFGDLIGPLIVEKLADEFIKNKPTTSDKRLLSIGSILHFAQNGDTVWGTGRNGKIHKMDHKFDQLDVRAVRGPLTKKFLNDKGIDVPEVYGDPALLLPTLFPELSIKADTKKHEITFIPNLNDISNYKDIKNKTSPTTPLFEIIERIIQSEFVVGSSLHAIIVAEAFGIPARIIKSQTEDDFKYKDHLLGTGRQSLEFAETYKEACSMGPQEKISWDKKNLLEAFPRDLWIGNKP
jgi:pyruvyltransferase